MTWNLLTSPRAGRVREVGGVAEHAGHVGVAVAEVEHVVVLVDGEVTVVLLVSGRFDGLGVVIR